MHKDIQDKKIQQSSRDAVDWKLTKRDREAEAEIHTAELLTADRLFNGIIGHGFCILVFVLLPVI